MGVASAAAGYGRSITAYVSAQARLDLGLSALAFVFACVVGHGFTVHAILGVFCGADGRLDERVAVIVAFYFACLANDPSASTVKQHYC